MNVSRVLCEEVLLVLYGNVTDIDSFPVDCNF